MPKTTKKKSTASSHKLEKCPTGITGFDEVTEGGLPKNRTTLISGSTGTGKTLLGLDFLIRGATIYKDPGVFMSFEETEEELYKDVESLNLDLKKLVSQKKIIIDYVQLDRRDLQASGEFNLEGLFVRLDHAINTIGAKRVVLDSIESVFAGVSDLGILRLEIKRLFRWLKEKKVTTLVTGELGNNYTRHGIEEFISDCIILLDNRVKEQIAVRRIRVVKYRGSNHGANEYPFVIDENGLSVIPITAAGLDQPGTKHKVSTGIQSLDELFKGRRGYTVGSTVLVSGTAGTGKTSLAAAFALASCKRGEHCLFLSYEESPGQLVQNMSSIGIHLGPWVKKGSLKIVSTRPSFFGLEMHLLDLYKLVADFKPKCVVIDPLTSLLGQGDQRDVRSMITRMIDLLKSNGITTFFTSLVSTSAENDTSGEIGVSSLIDTWIVVRELEEDAGKKRTRGLFIVKSRGASHSSDIHKLIMSDDGITLEDMEYSDKLLSIRNRKKRTGKTIVQSENEQMK